MEPGRSSPYWLDRCCLRPSTESRHSRCRILRRSITLPARTAADASPAPSQVPTHGSRRNVDWLLLRSEGLSPSVICQLAWRSYPRVPPGIPQSARQSRFPPPLTPLTPRGPPPRLPPGPAIEGPAACGRRVAVPSRLPLPAAPLPVEFADRAAACAPLRRRSRHSDPFRAGIHRRLAGNGPLAAS